jgi:excinuclease ABC subunit B
VRYLHSEVEVLERTAILADLRRGTFDVLVGINLLREGLDLPEVSLVAILDADKEGFLRSATSLVQTIGRTARNVNGTVILYADRMTDSLKKAIDETNRRRAVQEAYNTEHGIEPKTIIKDIASPLLQLSNLDYHDAAFLPPTVGEVDVTNPASLAKAIGELEKQMKAAAKRLEFEEAAQIRDRIKELRAQQIYKT